MTDQTTQVGGSGDLAVDPGSKEGDKATSAEELTEQITALTKERDDAFTERDGLKKTVGDQGNVIGQHNKMVSLLESDLPAFLQHFADQGGVKIRFEDDGSAKSPAITDDDGAIDKASLSSFIDERAARAAKAVTAHDRAVMEEHNLSQKHKDWDSLRDDRKAINLAQRTGQIPVGEILHFAAQGMRMAKVLEEATKASDQKGYDRAIEEIKNKTKGGLADAGGHGEPPKPGEATGKQRFDGALRAMKDT
jgi:hypothetical protein